MPTAPPANHREAYPKQAKKKAVLSTHKKLHCYINIYITENATENNPKEGQR